jgi:hypothetical protein
MAEVPAICIGGSMRNILKACSVFAVGLLPSVAYAQNDRCSDILADGTKSYEHFQQSDYYQQIVYSRLLSSNSRQAREKSKGAFSVPTGEAVFGGNYSDDSYRQKQAAMQATNFSKITSDQELDVALVSGDSEIIGAWKECMTKKSGVAMYFERNTGAPRQAILHIMWYPSPGVSQVKLTDGIPLPQGVLASGSDACLRRGTKLTALTDCSVQLSLPSALTTVTALVKTDHGNATAFLPSRLKFRRDVKRYIVPLSGSDLNFSVPANDTQGPVRSFPIMPEDVQNGYAFDQSSIRVNAGLLWGGGGGGRCAVINTQPDPYVVTATFRWDASSRASVGCNIIMSAMVTKDEFVAEDAK